MVQAPAPEPAALSPDAGAAEVHPAAVEAKALPELPKLPGLIGGGRSYRYVFSGPRLPNGRIEQVIAARNVGPEYGAHLDVLSVTGAPPVTITRTPTAHVGGIRVSTGVPAGILFLDSVDPVTATGVVMFADLAKPGLAVRLSEDAKGMLDGMQFGATGHQILFTSNYDPQTRTGRLFWTDGSSKPVLIGERASFHAMAFSEDRSVAYVGTQFDPATATGELLRVDMATGKASRLASGVVLLASSYAQVDAHLTDAPEMAFGVSPDGRHVAFALRDHSVLVASDGREPTVVAKEGRFPSPSPDGHSVAFFSGSDFVVSSGGRVVSTIPANGELLASWSPDSRYVAFLTKAVQRGLSPLYGTFLGDISILKPGASKAVAWAADAAWKSLTFSSAKGATQQVSVIARLKDITGTATLDHAIGDILVGTPTAPGAPVVTGVSTESPRRLPNSGGYVFTKSSSPFAMKIYETTAGLWRPRSGVHDLLPRAWEASARTFDLHGTDEAFVLTDVEATPFEGRLPISTLQRVVPGDSPVKLKERVMFALFANDGHVLAVTPEAAGNANVWYLPLSP